MEAGLPPGMVRFVNLKEKTMNYRCFAVISLCCVLFFSLLCGNVALGNSNSTLRPAASGVVQANRTPSEDDLAWLFGNTATHIPNAPSSSEIVQATYISGSISGSVVADNPGIADRSSIMNMAATILQMSADRLPPPEVPRELEIAPLIDVTPRTPAAAPSRDQENRALFSDFRQFFNSDFDNVFDSDLDDPCCFACLALGDSRRHHADRVGAGFDVPNMIGSSAWLRGRASTGFASPTMLLTRPNVIEHFNADTQNRVWLDYRSWNHAVAIGAASRGVEQFSFGLEKRLLRNRSVELRVPVIYQFGSATAGETETALEAGNISVFLKQVLRRTPRWTLSGGIGSSLPTARDWRTGDARLKNEAYNLATFVGVQWHPSRCTFGHFVVQSDIPVERNKLLGGGKVQGEQVIRTGLQLGQWLGRNSVAKRPSRIGIFAEVNYAVATRGSGTVEGLSSVSARTSSLSAAVGMPMVFGDLTATNSLILPLYSVGKHPFGVGYNFSLSRQF